MLMVPIFALLTYGAFKLLGRAPKYTRHLCFWGLLWLLSLVVNLSYQV